MSNMVVVTSRRGSLRLFLCPDGPDGWRLVPESGRGRPAGGRKAALSPVLMSKVSEKSVRL